MVDVPVKIEPGSFQIKVGVILASANFRVGMGAEYDVSQMCSLHANKFEMYCHVYA
jgi:hypothetical protein